MNSLECRWHCKTPASRFFQRARFFGDSLEFVDWCWRQEEAGSRDLYFTVVIRISGGIKLGGGSSGGGGGGGGGGGIGIFSTQTGSNFPSNWIRSLLNLNFNLVRNKYLRLGRVPKKNSEKSFLKWANKNRNPGNCNTNRIPPKP